MRRATYIVLKMVYTYSKLIGYFPLEYNHKTGRFYTTKYLTIYTVFINILLLCSLPFLYDDSFTNFSELRNHLLHQVVYAIAGSLRFGVGVTTIIFNWKKRFEIIAVVDEFQELRESFFKHFVQEPKAKQRHYRAILQKIFFTFLTEVGFFSVGMYTFRNILSWKLILRFGVVYVWVEMINLILLEGYLASLIINNYFSLLNEELKRILQIIESDKLGTKTLDLERCELLSTQLENLMNIHWKLTKLVDRMNTSVEWQSAFISLGIFFHYISMVYGCYTVVVRQNPIIVMTPVSGTLFVIAFIAYIRDSITIIQAIFDLLDLSTECAVILKENGALLCFPFYKQLEQGLERFSLQLTTKRPLITILGLYEINKRFAFLAFSSVFLHTLLLMLFDYQYF